MCFEVDPNGPVIKSEWTVNGTLLALETFVGKRLYCQMWCDLEVTK